MVARKSAGLKCMADVLIICSRGSPGGPLSRFAACFLPRKRHAVGPFLFFDHFVRGARAFQDNDRPATRISAVTVTTFFEGRMVHRDSIGSVHRSSPVPLIG